MGTKAALACAAVLALSTASAPAQVVTWLWTVGDTGNGDGLIEPGESAQLSLWAGFEPSQFRAGFAYAGPYDILGDGAWALGSVDELDQMLYGFYPDAWLDDSNNIRDIWHLQLPVIFGAYFNYDNPIELVEIRWTPGDYTPSSVTLDNGGPDARIYTDVMGNYLLYTGAGGSITFSIVPSPAAAVLLALGAVATCRRRR